MTGQSAASKAPARPAAPGSRSAPRAIGNAYRQLFSVQFQHGYYNANAGECPDFKVVPTPDCATLMTSLGMIFKDQGIGFSVLISQDRIGAMLSYVASRYNAAAPGQGYWSWLSFLLIPLNPQFIGITSLPITTNPMMQNLHISNLQTMTTKSGTLLGGSAGLDATSLYPVTGPNLSVPTPSGSTATLADLSGALVSPRTSTTDATTVFDLSTLAYGFYTIGLVNAAGKPVKGGAQTSVLYVPGNPISLCLLDLLLTQPAAGIGTPAAFPIPPLPAPPTGAAVPSGALQPVNLVLPFRPRETIWNYYVVSQGARGAFTGDLQITGKDATFVRSGKAQALPNGDQAVLFTAGAPLTLQQHSQYRFKLSGQRQGANGSRDTISVARLPVAPAGPVWPLKGKPLAGSSEIFVYV